MSFSNRSVVWRLITIALAAIVFFINSSLVASADANSITFNGASIPSDSLVNHNGVPFVWIRPTFEKVGATVHFANPNVTAMQGGKNVLKVAIGSTAATVKGQPDTLKAAPYMASGKTYIPLEAFAKAFGATYTHGANGWQIKAPVVAAAAGAVNGAANAAGNAASAASNATSQATGGGIPWWLWLLLILAALIALWYFMRNRGQASTNENVGGSGGGPLGGLGSVAGGLGLASLAPMLLSHIPNLGGADAQGLAQNILGRLGTQGQQVAQNAGVDTQAAATGDKGALQDLINHVQSNSPGVLQNAVSSLAQNSPSFLQNLPGPLGSIIGNLVGKQ